MTEPSLSLLQRREIEAKVLGPFLRELEAEIGRERTLALTRRAIEALARESGAELARELGETTLLAFSQAIDRWAENDALEIDWIERNDSSLAFNVVRCRFAELYRALGLEDLGSSLSCRRDFALVEGFNPEIALTRTQTLMDGATHCDFRFKKIEKTEASRKSDPNVRRLVGEDF